MGKGINERGKASGEEKQKKRENEPLRKGIEYQLREFYRKNNPAKLVEIPRILASFRGREEELLKKLRFKYGIHERVHADALAGAGMAAKTAAKALQNLCGNSNIEAVEVLREAKEERKKLKSKSRAKLFATGIKSEVEMNSGADEIGIVEVFEDLIDFIIDYRKRR